MPSALAAVLGLPIHTNDPLPRLIAAMHEREMLLVLDCCEHVIDAAAALAKQVLRATTRVRILATSREALRVKGERVQRLSPLEVPPKVNGITAAQALSFPAVELFVERVLSTADTFELTDADAPTVAEICRRLDGIALAIELAATRVVAFGVRGVAARIMIGSDCLRAAIARRSRGTGRWGPRWTGATNCFPNWSASCFSVSPSSQGASR